jgi:hypothetical protein
MINLYIGEDKFSFSNLEALFKFVNHYTTEKLIDSNFAELEYAIIVEDK